MINIKNFTQKEYQILGLLLINSTGKKQIVCLNQIVKQFLIYCMCLTILKKIRRAYISEHNSMHKNQIILLMSSDDKKWHYRAIKNCLNLQNNIKTWDFNCLSYFHSFSPENKLHAKVMITAI